MRIVRDGYGDVLKDGTVIHSSVRFLVDDQKRLAVFPTKAEPTIVYGPNEVTYTVSRKPCACKGDWPKMTLQRAWMNVDKVNA